MTLSLIKVPCINRNIFEVTARKFSVTRPQSKTVALSHVIYEPQNKTEDVPPLLITHGLLGSKQNWSSIAKAVSRSTSRRVITFDARNHGESPHTDEMNYDVMVEDIRNLAASLCISKFTLIGHSMGGIASMSFALTYPDPLEKLVIVDIAPVVRGDFSGNERYLKALIKVDFTGHDKNLSSARKFADKALEEAVPDKPTRQFLLTNITQDKDTGKVHFRPNISVLLKNINEIRDFPVHLKSKTFNKSTLAIRGSNSSYVTEKEIPEIKALFPTAEILTVDNSGHLPHVENPHQFLSYLLPFLKQPS